MTAACALCGTPLAPAPHGGCASCPLANGCSILCCPACGFTDVNAERSVGVRALRGVGRALRRRTAPPPGTLAAAERGSVVHVETLDGLPPERREQLVAHGVAPGERLEVLQTAPAVVVRVERVELALERELAAAVPVAATGRSAA